MFKRLISPTKGHTAIKSWFKHSKRIGAGRVKSNELTQIQGAQLVKITKVDPEFKADLRTNFKLKLARNEHDINGLPITREWEEQVVLDERMIIFNLYESGLFNKKSDFLSVFDYYYRKVTKDNPPLIDKQFSNKVGKVDLI